MQATVFLDDIIADRIIGDRLGLLERLECEKRFEHVERLEYAEPPTKPNATPNATPEPARESGVGEIDLTCYEVLSDDEDGASIETPLEPNDVRRKAHSWILAQHVLAAQLEAAPFFFPTL